MTEHFTITLDDGTVLSLTKLPAEAYLVRVMIDEIAYDRMINVVESPDGKTLTLWGWIGPSLSHNQWKSAKNVRFPAATHVEFERWCPRRKAYRWVKLKV